MFLMPHNSGDRTARVDASASDRDFQLALVVATSHVNRIVVSRIAANAGLKVVAGSPDDATSLLPEKSPGVIILDGGADDRECERLIESLAMCRRDAGRTAPFVILLSNTTATTAAPGNHPHSNAIDAIVAKPITPEKLQPLIQGLLDRVRG